MRLVWGRMSREVLREKGVGCEHVPEAAVGAVGDGVKEDELDVVRVEDVLVRGWEGSEYDLEGEGYRHDFHEAVPEVEVCVLALDENGGGKAADVFDCRDGILLAELDEAVEEVARSGRVPIRWEAA